MPVRVEFFSSSFFSRAYGFIYKFEKELRRVVGIRGGDGEVQVIQRVGVGAKKGTLEDIGILHLLCHRLVLREEKTKGEGANEELRKILKKQKQNQISKI